jgi:hypothetical protein
MTINDTIVELNKLPKQPIRLLLQGPPGEGKTWSALTFPNPIIRNFDNKLSGYQNEFPDSKIRVVNFDENLVVKILCVSNMGFGKPNNPNKPLNIKDAARKWLEVFGKELTENDTLIEDSWTSLQNKFDIQMSMDHEIPVSKKTGEKDGYYFWKMKMAYANELTDLYKTLKCNTVVICHEVQERNEDGFLTGKLKPLMQGGFADQMAGQFTDAYRQICLTKDMKKEYLDKYELSLGRKIIGEREYFWQTKSSGIFTACLSVKGLKDIVPATYESLIKKTI